MAVVLSLIVVEEVARRRLDCHVMIWYIHNLVGSIDHHRLHDVHVHVVVVYPPQL